MMWSWRSGLAAMLGLVLVAAPGSAGAQAIAGVQEVTNFRLPEHGEDGQLKSLMLGDRASISPEGLITIQNLRFELYGGGRTNLRVWAERCVYDRKAGVVTSDAPVRIERPGMQITGKGLSWSSTDGRVRILTDVRLLGLGGRSWFQVTGPQE